MQFSVFNDNLTILQLNFRYETYWKTKQNIKYQAYSIALSISMFLSSPPSLGDIILRRLLTYIGPSNYAIIQQ